MAGRHLRASEHAVPLQGQDEISVRIRIDVCRMQKCFGPIGVAKRVPQIQGESPTGRCLALGIETSVCRLQDVCAPSMLHGSVGCGREAGFATGIAHVRLRLDKQSVDTGLSRRYKYSRETGCSCCRIDCEQVRYLEGMYGIDWSTASCIAQLINRGFACSRGTGCQ